MLSGRSQQSHSSSTNDARSSPLSLPPSYNNHTNKIKLTRDIESDISENKLRLYSHLCKRKQQTSSLCLHNFPSLYRLVFLRTWKQTLPLWHVVFSLHMNQVLQLKKKTSRQNKSGQLKKITFLPLPWCQDQTFLPSNDLRIQEMKSSKIHGISAITRTQSKHLM